MRIQGIIQLIPTKMKLLSFTIFAFFLLTGVDASAQSKRSLHNGPAKEQAGQPQTIQFSFSKRGDKPEMHVPEASATRKSHKGHGARFRSGEESVLPFGAVPVEPVQLAGSVREEAPRDPEVAAKE